MRLLTLLLLCTAAWGVEPANVSCTLTEDGATITIRERRAVIWNGGAKHLPLVAWWCVEELPEEFRPAIERVRIEILRNTHNVYLPPSNIPDAPQTIRWRVSDKLVNGAALAEAYYPWHRTRAGEIVVNSCKDWSRFDLYSVGLHEAGHAVLGLGHGIMRGTVMYPGYQLLSALTPPDLRQMERVVNIRIHPFQWRIH